MTTDINGDVIDAITIDGQGVSEVTVDGDVVFQQSAIPDSVVTQYRFEDTSTSTILDSVGSNNANAIGGNYSTNSKEGSFSYEFDSSNDEYIKSNNTVDLINSGNTGNFGMGGWLFPRRRRSNQWDYTINYEQNGNNNVIVQNDNSGSDNWQVFIQINGNNQTFDTGVTMQLSTWTHVWVNFKNGDCEFYKNGSLIATESINGNLTDIGFANLVVGIRLNLTDRDRYFDGFADNIIYSNDALTLSEINNII